MQVSNANNVKIYSITSASKSAIPEWQVMKNKNKLKHDQSWRNRIELIQDFQFPEASIKLKATKDGNFLMATGVYKPQIRVFDLNEMALKFERHSDCENVNFILLSDDWTKSVHLQTDRTIEFHSHYGLHYKTRIPKFGRDLSYHYPSCDVLVVGASHEVWRMNLELGRFMAPLETTLPEINVSAISPAHQLFGFGGANGRVEFWHPNEKKRIGILDVAETLVKSIDSSLFDSIPEISAIEYSNDGLSVLVGTTTGQALLYDLRNTKPLIIKDHQYGFPIKSLKFHASDKIASADTKIVKFWDKNDGKIFTNLEAPGDINDMCIFGDSGLVMLGNEGVEMQSYYIPQLGAAPAWCSYLDNLTEELEENPDATIYDDYKFVTKKELSNLGLDHLIGTETLKAYMHGFFVDLRLYEKAKAIANPFQFEEYKKKMVQKRIADKRASRISTVKKLPKVNKALASELLDRANNESKKKKDTGILNDNRFSGLFNDPEFEVDEDSKEYRLHHPSANQGKTSATQYGKFEEVSDSSDDEETKPKLFEIKDGFEFSDNNKKTAEKEKLSHLTFEEKLVLAKEEAQNVRIQGALSGNASISFKPKKKRVSKK